MWHVDVIQHCYRNRRCDCHSSQAALRHGTTIGRIAPELGAIQVRPEAVISGRQSQADLSGRIGCAVVAGIRAAGESIDRQPTGGIAVGIFNRHKNWIRRRDRDAGATRHRTIILGRAPELGPIHIDAEAITSGRQGDGGLAVCIGDLAVTGVSTPIEGVDCQALERFPALACHRYRNNRPSFPSTLYHFDRLGAVPGGVIGVLVGSQRGFAIRMLKLGQLPGRVVGIS